MHGINLLPADLTPKKSILKLSSAAKKISIVGYSLVLISAVVFVGIFFMLSRQIQTSLSNQARLKSTISSLEQTEQRLILVKDRLEKVDKVLGSKSANQEIEFFDDLLSMFPEGVSLDEANLSAEGTKITLKMQKSSSLVEFLATLLSSGTYSHIELESFAYNSQTGYKVVLKFRS